MPKIYNLTDTWNDGATVFDAIKINVTDSASSAGSKLIDLQVAGASKFKVDKEGNATSTGDINGASPTEMGYLSGVASNIQTQINAKTTNVDTNLSTTQTTTTVDVVSSDGTDATLPQAIAGGNAGVMSGADKAKLDGISGTNTGDDAVNSLYSGLVTNATHTGEVTGDTALTVDKTLISGKTDITTPATDDYVLVGDTSDTDNLKKVTAQSIADLGGGGGAFGADANTLITASTPIVLDQATGDEAALTLDYTTNKAAGNDTGVIINQTDTASPGTSKLLDLQVGGSSKFNVDSVGTATSVYGFQAGRNSTGGVMLGNAYGFYGLGMGSQGRVAWGPASPFASPDLVVLRDAAGTLGQRNGVNAQAFNIYNTYTSATAFERGFLKWDADTFVIGTEAGSGGGTGRHIKLTTDSGNYVNLTNGGVFYMNPGLVQSWQNRSRIDSPSFGVLKLADSNNVSFGRLQLGGVSTSFPAIKRSGANIHLRLADDSAFTGLSLADLEPSGDITHTGSNVGFYGVSPTAQAAHIADATNATDVITRVNAILVALENIGITAAV
jgi:hypothetical protein